MPRPHPPYLNLSLYKRGLTREASEQRLAAAITQIGGRVEPRLVRLPRRWLGKIGHDSLFSAEARALEQPAVCLLLDAEYTEQRRLLQGLFDDLVCAFSPDYAGWAVEESLPCAKDLAAGHWSGHFRNFYVSKEFLGASALAKLQRLTTDWKVRTLHQGYFFDAPLDITRKELPHIVAAITPLENP